MRHCQVVLDSVKDVLHFIGTQLSEVPKQNRRIVLLVWWLSHQCPVLVLTHKHRLLHILVVCPVVVAVRHQATLHKVLEREELGWSFDENNFLVLGQVPQQGYLREGDLYHVVGDALVSFVRDADVVPSGLKRAEAILQDAALDLGEGEPLELGAEVTLAREHILALAPQDLSGGRNHQVVPSEEVIHVLQFPGRAEVVKVNGDEP